MGRKNEVLMLTKEQIQSVFNGLLIRSETNERNYYMDVMPVQNVR